MGQLRQKPGARRQDRWFWRTMGFLIVAACKHYRLLGETLCFNAFPAQTLSKEIDDDPLAPAGETPDRQRACRALRMEARAGGSPTPASRVAGATPSTPRLDVG